MIRTRKRPAPANQPEDNSKPELTAVNQETPVQVDNKEQAAEQPAEPKKKSKLFSQGAIDTAVERSEEYSEYLPDAPPGAYPESIFMGAELIMSKAKQPMIVLEVDCDEKYSTVKEFNVFPENNERVAQVSQNKVVDFMLQGFEYKLKPVDGTDMVEILNGILEQMNKFKDKKLGVAIKGEQDVYTATGNDGSTEVKETIRARIWYVRKHGTPLNFNAAKSIKTLTPAERQKITERNSGKVAAPPVKRELNEAEKAEILGNLLLNEEEKSRMIDKGVTEGGGDVPAWARS